MRSAQRKGLLLGSLLLVILLSSGAAISNQDTDKPSSTDVCHLVAGVSNVSSEMPLSRLGISMKVNLNNRFGTLNFIGSQVSISSFDTDANIPKTFFIHKYVRETDLETVEAEVMASFDRYTAHGERTDAGSHLVQERLDCRDDEDNMTVQTKKVVIPMNFGNSSADAGSVEVVLMNIADGFQIPARNQDGN